MFFLVYSHQKFILIYLPMIKKYIIIFILQNNLNVFFNVQLIVITFLIIKIYSYEFTPSKYFINNIL